MKFYWEMVENFYTTPFMEFSCHRARVSPGLGGERGIGGGIGRRLGDALANATLLLDRQTPIPFPIDAPDFV
jgi:hypothetical protein